MYPSATADLSLGGLAEPGRQVVDTTRSSEAGTPPAALGSAVAAPTGGGAQGVRRSPLELPKHHVRSEGYLMPVACGARLRCSATRACSRAQLRERVVDFVSALALAAVALALAALALASALVIAPSPFASLVPSPLIIPRWSAPSNS